MQGSPRQPSSAGEPTAAPLASSNSAGHGDRAQQPRQQPEGAHTAVPMPPEPPVPPFGVSRSQLFALNDAKDTDGLRALGGAPRLARLLLCDLKEGINGADADEEDRHGSGRHASSSLGKHAAKQGGAAADGVSGGVTMPAPSIAERVKVYGANEMAAVPPKSLLALIWDNLQDPILLLLIAAALVSTVLGAAIPEERHESGWVEGVAIWVAIAVVVLVSSFNDYSKDRQFAALNRQRDVIEVTVVRGGAEVRVHNTQVVVGDLLVVCAGDKVAADGVLAVPGLDRGGLLAADESSLTGESEPVKKSVEEDPWVRCGTQVQEGGGRVLVLAVGGDTEYGRTLAIVGSAGGQDTPLTEKLGHLASAIGKIGGAAAVVLFIVLMVIWMVRNRGFPIKKINDRGPVQFFLYCVTLVVVAVPEGLPLAVTISLAYSMRQMMDDQCFVRVLEACETMGGCTAICSDKTGTLTQNRMTVVEGWIAPGTKFSRAPRAAEVPRPLLDDLRRGIALNSRAFLVEPAAAARGGGGGAKRNQTPGKKSPPPHPPAPAAAVAAPRLSQPPSLNTAAPSRASSTSASVAAASRMTLAGSSVAGGGDSSATAAAVAAAPYGVDGVTGLEAAAAGDQELGLEDVSNKSSGSRSRRKAFGGTNNAAAGRMRSYHRGGGGDGGGAKGAAAWHERAPASWLLLRPCWRALAHLCVGIVHCLPPHAAGAAGFGGRTASAVSDDGEASEHDGADGAIADGGGGGGGAGVGELLYGGGGGGGGAVVVPPRIQMVGNRTECALLLLMDYAWRQQQPQQPPPPPPQQQQQQQPPHPQQPQQQHQLDGVTAAADSHAATAAAVAPAPAAAGGGDEPQTYDALRRLYEGGGRLEHVYGFTSESKMSSVAVRLPDGRLRLYTKGAAEWVLRQCTSVQTSDGRGTQPLDEVARQLLTRQVVDDMAARGLRCIGLAARDVPEPAGGAGGGGWPEGYWEEAPVEDMTLQALLGIKDPVRPEVPAAVATCQRAGITVRMVTGDNINTARFIARECGILTDTAGSDAGGADGGGGGGGGGLALEGPAFRALSDAQLDAALPRLQVLARSSPSDKHRLVRALRAQREVVAVTGDGTNDAPALKESDVGLAMGITGTEVAKEAADIVVLDDNFSSIVRAVLWGRTVFENIRKFVAFQLTVNIVALVVAFVGAIAGGHQPLTVLQLLWVNLIMDTLAALALATERPDPQILDRAPYGRRESLITGVMLRYMLSQAAYQIAVLFFMLYAVPVVLPARYGEAVDPNHTRSLSLLFNTFILCQVFNEINSRRISDELNVFARLHRSPIFLAVLAVTVGAQVIIMELLGSFFDVKPLDWREWLVSVALGAVSLPLSTLVRLAGRSWDRRHRPQSGRGAAAAAGAAMERRSSGADGEGGAAGRGGGGGGPGSGGGGKGVGAEVEEQEQEQHLAVRPTVAPEPAGSRADC